MTKQEEPRYCYAIFECGCALFLLNKAEESARCPVHGAPFVKVVPSAVVLRSRVERLEKALKKVSALSCEMQLRLQEIAKEALKEAE